MTTRSPTPRPVRVLKRPRRPRADLDLEGPEYMSRDEALLALSIKASTLYTYVSRGLVKSVPVPGTRKKLFARADVDQLRTRSDAHAGTGPRAQGAMQFGEPIIASSITQVTAEGPIYRGHNAIDLAAHGATFEAVSHLLWQGTMADDDLHWQVAPPRVSPAALVRALDLPLPPQDVLKLFTSVVLSLGMPSTGLDEIGSGRTVPLAQEIILTLAGCCGFLCDQRPGFVAPRAGETVAWSIARALRVKPLEQAATLINAALVLCADIELASGTFAARIAASAGSDLYACVCAGISAHSGELIGRGAEKAEELLMAGGAAQLVRKLATSRLQGKQAYGFNYRMFPEGDPRARLLLGLLKGTPGLKREALGAIDLIERAEAECGARPGIGAALAVLGIALGSPRRSAVSVWIIGRIAGLVAHVIEQRTQGFMLRPRARYEQPVSR